MKNIALAILAVGLYFTCQFRAIKSPECKGDWGALLISVLAAIGVFLV